MITRRKFVAGMAAMIGAAGLIGVNAYEPRVVLEDHPQRLFVTFPGTLKIGTYAFVTMPFTGIWARLEGSSDAQITLFHKGQMINTGDIVHKGSILKLKVTNCLKDLQGYACELFFSKSGEIDA